MEHPPYEHFEGKSVYEHLKDARERGAKASAEVHGLEMPGHIAAACDTAKEIAIVLALLFVLCQSFSLNAQNTWIVCSLLALGYLLWKTGRSAMLGWSRLERLHRVIEEERWEIEHHRQQEREELIELYKIKGFQGKLLEEVIDVLMADDNRLLRVMLEEELNLTLEWFEHPLKQAAGAAVGGFFSALFILGIEFFFPGKELFLAAAACSIAFSCYIAARLEKNKPLPHVVWNLGIAGLAAGFVYLCAQLFTTHIS